MATSDNFAISAPRKKRRGPRFTPEQRRAAQSLFLQAFAISANLSAAARHAGIDREMVRYWQEHDEAFSFRYQQAKAESDDVVRGEVFRRAIQGVDKPLHYQGRVVVDERGQRLTVKEYSDTLLIFLAKARMPEFRDKQQIEHSGSLDVNVLASEADAKFSAFLATLTAGTVLGKSDSSAEG